MRYRVEHLVYRQLTLDGGEEDVSNVHLVTLEELADLMGSREAANSLVTEGTCGSWKMV